MRYVFKVSRQRPWRLWAAAVFVAVIVTGFAYNGLFPPMDPALSRSVQEARSPWLQPISEFLYRFGLSPAYPLAALAAAGLLVLTRGLKRGWVPGLFLMLAAAARPAGTIIKELVERPRPDDLSVRFVEGASGYSFPSGHVFGTVLLVGFAWFLVMESAQSFRVRLGASIAAGSFVLMMGLQRVYAGAHWPSDVAGAYLWGGIVLFLVVQLYLLCSRRQLFRSSSSLTRHASIRKPAASV